LVNKFSCKNSILSFRKKKNKLFHDSFKTKSFSPKKKTFGTIFDIEKSIFLPSHLKGVEKGERNREKRREEKATTLI